MAFIDAKNFILPLIEKKTIISILMVTVVFGAFRLSGAHVEVRARNTQPAGSFSEEENAAPIAQKREGTVSLKGSTPLDDLMELNFQHNGTGGTGAATNGGAKQPRRSARVADPLDAMVRPAPKEPEQKETRRRPLGELADIERDLGLRQ